jgi:hypothetical protein
MGVAECAIAPMETGPSLSPISYLNDGFREGLNQRQVVVCSGQQSSQADAGYRLTSYCIYIMM